MKREIKGNNDGKEMVLNLYKNAALEIKINS